MVFTIGSSSAASAHANYLRSDPAPNAHLVTPPTRVVVAFSERVVVGSSGLVLLDAAGKPVAGDVRTTDDPTELALPLPPLGDGVYAIAWHTVSAEDGDPASGYFAFMVGTHAAVGGNGVSKSASQNNIAVTLSIAPLFAGENRYSVTVSGTSNVSRVRLRVTPLDRDIGQSEIVLPALGATYAATGLELPIAGRYQVQVQVRRSDTLADLAYDFEFSVPRAASPTPSVARSAVTVTTTTTATPLASDSPSVILALLATLGFFAIILAGLLAWRRR